MKYEVDKLSGHAVLIGYDDMARNAVKTLEDHFDDIVIVDNNSENVEKLSESKYEYIYGDFKHSEIRHAAKIENADFILSVAPDLEANKKAVKDARDATVFVKATRRNEAAELYDMGAHYVIMKNYLTGDKMADYIRVYLKDKSVFERNAADYLNNIHWSDRNV
jgi:voltage-gated potassium channel Kch